MDTTLAASSPPPGVLQRPNLRPFLFTILIVFLILIACNALAYSAHG